MEPGKPKRMTFTATGYEHPVVGAIRDLGIYHAEDGALYSIWRPTWRERLSLIFGKPIVVGVLSNRQPPMTVQVGEDRIP
jgi:hypothetical protein